MTDMFSEPIINVSIPYEPGEKLGRAYNRIMQESDHEWNLLLDWDVLLLNPQWYTICQRAISYLEKTSKPAGIITAMANNSPAVVQKSYNCPRTMDLVQHKRWAEALFQRHQVTIREVEPPYKFAGYFMLTNKTVWAASGGFPDELYVDYSYCRRVRNCGFKLYILPGLYVYHATETPQETVFLDDTDIREKIKGVTA